MPEREIDPRRLLWVGPLTILSSIAAVLGVRAVALRLLVKPRKFEPLDVGPPIFDTAVLVAAALIVFAFVAGASARPFRLYRRIAFVALLVSFVPDLLLPGRFPNATWPLATVLMMMHVAAWAVTVTMLTTLTARREDASER
ncbi:MAG: DUF6069 family protein [Acidobacteriia bacterium]|nr:DUF6069 family protein [Terriglobia bacterium]